MPAGLLGSLLVLTVSAQERVLAEEPAARVITYIGQLVVLSIPGWLLGVVTVGMIRLFRVAPWAYPFVGMVVGPFIGSLFIHEANVNKEWGAIALVLSVFGLLVGLVECGRVSLLQKEAARRGE